MGKYMRKAKLSGEVAVMEVSHQSSLGVRTRARTLAAAALQNPAATNPNDSSLAYLELRSRRLEKTLPPPQSASKQQHKDAAGKDAPSPKPKRSSRANSVLPGSISMRRCSTKDQDAAPDLEVSFGENVLEAEERERYARETTPCSLIRDSEMIRTPSSTTRSNSGTTNRRMLTSVRRDIPTAFEMEEFFAGSEQLQQQIFIEKYNFDPVNDCPIPGRYEWMKHDF